MRNDRHSPSLARVTLLALAAPLALACSSPEQQDRRANPSEARDSAARGMMGNGMMGGNRMMGGNAMMGGGMMGASMPEMRVIRGLLGSAASIERTVRDVPGGVLTLTRSDDRRVAELIRAHVRQMSASYDRGEPIRTMDPVFRELFANRDRMTLRFEDVPGGIRVLHTSPDPQVVSLIRQHAHRFVSEAAEQGMRRAMRPTPLPQGYRRPAPASAALSRERR